jgi:hypothetical protein
MTVGVDYPFIAGRFNTPPFILLSRLKLEINEKKDCLI